MKMIFLYGFVVATVGGALVEASYREGNEQVSISAGFSLSLIFFLIFLLVRHFCSYVICSYLNLFVST